MLHKAELSSLSAPLNPSDCTENLFRLSFGRSYPAGKDTESTEALQLGFDKSKQMCTVLVEKGMKPLFHRSKTVLHPTFTR